MKEREGLPMMTRMENKQIKFHMITIENLVPEKRQVVDFSFIYEETKDYGFPHNKTALCHPAGSIAPFVVSSPFHDLRVVSCKLT